MWTRNVEKEAAVRFSTRVREFMTKKGLQAEIYCMINATVMKMKMFSVSRRQR